MYAGIHYTDVLYVYTINDKRQGGKMIHCICVIETQEIHKHVWTNAVMLSAVR